MGEKFALLEEKLKEVWDLSVVMELLGWDQEVNMPAGAGEARGAHLATLSKIHHERLTSAEMGELLAAAQAEVKGQRSDGYAPSLVRVGQRKFDQATKLPTELVMELTRLRSLAQSAWVKARNEDDYGLFQPWLEKLVDLVQQEAGYLGYEEHPYDALLDQYEPEMTTAEVAKLFAELRKELVPLVHEIQARADVVDNRILFGHFPEEAQSALGRKISGAVGFDYSHGRLDSSVHPFATSFTSHDVRLTTRYNEDYFGASFFGIMHETGHGLYEQGFDAQFHRTPLADGASLGIHESQSRLWENMVGRSRHFWRYALPLAQEAYPDSLSGVEFEAFYRAINQVTPSMIRVEADEVTYNLHIMLRFEIEQGLLTGDINPADLPDYWNSRMESYLGIRPKTNREGVLQDIHWAIGLFGYFPTYALGNLMAAQLYDCFLADHPDFPQEMEKGEFSTLLQWMREHVHRHGATYTPQVLMQKVTGEGVKVAPFMRYLRQKYSDIYGL
ncbi:MAG TPA: carboxypeptidase M32 [Anaerolineae bacterium]|nr:carboxypeptidase M32 [Anaerolineae bacterium]